MPLVAWKWAETGPLYLSRTALHRFLQKLKTLKHDIRALNKSRYGDLPIRTKKAFEDLCLCQEWVLANPCVATLLAETEAARKWHHLVRLEEQLYRSLIQWLELRDQNTRFYHNACQERAAVNNINILFTESGEVLTDISDIKREAVAYFQGFMPSQSDQTEMVSMEELQSLLSYRCPLPEASMLVAHFTAVEIRDTLMSLPNGKVPGPDGFTKEFFCGNVAYHMKRLHHCYPILLPVRILANMGQCYYSSSDSQKEPSSDDEGFSAYRLLQPNV